MPKIERRRTVVSLFQGNYEADLAALLERVMAAQRKEETQVRRMGQKSESLALAAEYDAMAEAARESAESVTLWAVPFRTWDLLVAKHPARDGDKQDAALGANRETFAADLLLASLVLSPAADLDPRDLDAVLTAGAAALDDLGDISRLHYAKLERAAFSVNVEDDALPKASLVSVLRLASELESKQQPESE